MKQFVIVLIAALCSATMAHAQKYLDHLQQRTPGQGTVTVKQSKEIDELVNGKAAKPQADKQKTETSQKASPYTYISIHQDGSAAWATSALSKRHGRCLPR